MKKTDKKSYYAVIPAEVRYDQSLSANAKLLYGEITALCSEKGFCWATNSYFAQLYNKEIKTISRWIALLIKRGYIQSVVEKKEGNKRQLYLSTKPPIPMDKNVHTYGQKCPYPMDKNVHTLGAKMSIPMDKNVPRNTKDNTTKNNTDNKSKISQKRGLSKADAQDRGYHLLIGQRVNKKIAREIVYDQQTPLSSIENVIKNGLAKEEHANRTDGGFVLEAGYIIESLNKARGEGKLIDSTKLSRKLAAKLSLNRKEYTPPSPAELQKRKRRIRAQAAAMSK